MNDRNLEQQRKHILLRLFFIMGLFIHTILLVLFIILDIRVLWMINIGSCLLFLFNFVLLRWKRYELSLQLAVLEIAMHSFAATLVIGWQSYFSLYFITTAVIVVNSFSLSLMWKGIESAALSILFIGLYLLTATGFRMHEVDSMVIQAIGLFNCITVSFTLLFLSFRNFTENDRMKKRLEEMSEMDMLTGAYNRRFFNKYLDIEIRRNLSQLRYRLSGEVNFGIAMLDIDNFKTINDAYGHLAGDRVLTEIVAIIKTVLFERDILCRYGGEEFVILFTATSRSGSVLAIEKIRKQVEEHMFVVDDNGNGQRITISIGFASFDEETNINRLLDLADKRLYDAKRRGKNMVVSG